MHGVDARAVGDLEPVEGGRALVGGRQPTLVPEGLVAVEQEVAGTAHAVAQPRPTLGSADGDHRPGRAFGGVLVTTIRSEPVEGEEELPDAGSAVTGRLQAC